MRYARRCLAAAALVVAAAPSAPLRAAVLQLAPIPIEVEAPQAAAVLSLGNRASAEVALQTRVFRWTQEDGEDKLTPTQDVVVSPPIATVPGGQTLTVRVLRRVGQPPLAEETYRILVDELPSEKSEARGKALRILMRYSVPVFFAPAGMPRDEPRLEWRLARRKDGLRLTATNPGVRRVRLSEIQLREPASGATAVEAGREPAGYVLAGRTMHWTLKPSKDFPAAANGVYRLEYRTEAGEHREKLALGSAS